MTCGGFDVVAGVGALVIDLPRRAGGDFDEGLADVDGELHFRGDAVG